MSTKSAEIDMAKAQRNRETIETMYGYANSGDTEAMLAIWDDDIVLVEAPPHPFPGEWKGKEAVQKATPGVIEGLNMVETEVVEWMAGENRVGCVIKIHCKDKDGEDFDIDCCELWGLNDEFRITSIRPYYHDLVLVRERLGLDD